MAVESPGDRLPNPESLERVLEREVDEDEPLTSAVVDAIGHLDADLSGSASGLNQYVDPDALNHLFADKFDGSDRRGGRVVLEIREYVVSITEGTVRVYGE